MGKGKLTTICPFKNGHKKSPPKGGDFLPHELRTDSYESVPAGASCGSTLRVGSGREGVSEGPVARQSSGPTLMGRSA